MTGNEELRGGREPLLNERERLAQIDPSPDIS